MTEKYLTILSNKKQIPYNRKREGAGMERTENQNSLQTKWENKKNNLNIKNTTKQQ